MKKMIRDEKYIETVRIHRSELNDIVFKDQGKEFLFKGEMYDIKDQKYEGDHLVFRCINDKTEKKLLAGLKEQIRNNGGTDSTPEQNKNNSGKSPVKDLFFHQKVHSNIPSSEISYPTLQYDLCSCEQSDLLSPPPENVFPDLTIFQNAILF